MPSISANDITPSTTELRIIYGGITNVNPFLSIMKSRA